MAHGMEDENKTKQNYNASLTGPKGKKRILDMAAEKARVGNKAPRTREEVNLKGPYVERFADSALPIC